MDHVNQLSIPNQSILIPASLVEISNHSHATSKTKKKSSSRKSKTKKKRRAKKTRKLRKKKSRRKSRKFNKRKATKKKKKGKSRRKPKKKRKSKLKSKSKRNKKSKKSKKKLKSKEEKKKTSKKKTTKKKPTKKSTTKKKTSKKATKKPATKMKATKKTTAKKPTPNKKVKKVKKPSKLSDFKSKIKSKIKEIPSRLKKVAADIKGIPKSMQKEAAKLEAAAKKGGEAAEDKILNHSLTADKVKTALDKIDHKPAKSQSFSAADCKAPACPLANVTGYGGKDITKQVQDAFKGGKFNVNTYKKPTTLYRCAGNASGKVGGWWSQTVPTTSSSIMKQEAISTDWGTSKLNNCYQVTIPAGTPLTEGVAGPQPQGSSHVQGGGQQTFLPQSVLDKVQNQIIPSKVRGNLNGDGPADQTVPPPAAPAA